MGCGNDKRQPVPSFPVSMDLNIVAEYPLFDPSFGTLQTMTFTEPRYPYEYVGYGGVLVVTAYDGEYHAFDLCCPHCLHRDSVVEVDGLYAICPLCGEEYDISYGLAVPTKGMSRFALRPFKTYKNGGHLIIKN